jgi:hypothetical protein
MEKAPPPQSCAADTHMADLNLDLDLDSDSDSDIPLSQRFLCRAPSSLTPLIDSDSDSESNVPLSRQFSSRAPSSLTPLTTPTATPAPTSLTPVTTPTHSLTAVYEHDNDGESEAPLSDDEGGEDVSLLDDVGEYDTPQPLLASGSHRKIPWVTTKLPRPPPKETRRFITNIGLLQNDEAQSLLKRLVPLLASPHTHDDC